MYNITTCKCADMQYGVARIFFGGGATRYIFVTSPGADRIQWGGGVVAEIIFRELNYRIGFSEGGGVVAEIFPVDKSITFPRFRDILGTFSGHLRIIRRLWTLAKIQGHFPCLLTHSNHVTTSIHSGKKHLTKVWPPPDYATVLNRTKTHYNAILYFIYKQFIFTFHL